MKVAARYVVPMDGPVIEDGAVVFRDGKIEAVGRRRDLHDDSSVDYGDAVICPGFVNAHTHLELTRLAGAVPPSSDFTDWLARLGVHAARTLPDGEAAGQSVVEGIARSLSHGVTTVGDITRFPAWTRGVLADSLLRGVSFGEVIAIGKRRHLLAERLEAAASPIPKSSGFTVGISPHAPYTLEPDGLRACAERAARIDAPLCIHLLETSDEEAFTRTGQGALADFLRTMDVWDEEIPVSGVTPLELVSQAGLLGRRTILAHANYASDADIAVISRSGASVAYCPRTHRAFGHPPHRFREMSAAAINVCIGTDSLASNPSLSVLEELGFLRQQFPDIPPEELLAMGTIRGARALGLEAVTGSITPGKRADLVVMMPAMQHRGKAWFGLLDDAAFLAKVYCGGAEVRSV